MATASWGTAPLCVKRSLLRQIVCAVQRRCVFLGLRQYGGSVDTGELTCVSHHLSVSST